MVWVGEVNATEGQTVALGPRPFGRKSCLAVTGTLPPG